jgi:hypothetical protein
MADSVGIDLPFFPEYFSNSDSTFSYSTGNWRGYIGKWQMENDTLYLLEIWDDDYEKQADLKQIFGEYYVDGKVMAFWYTGDLIIPKGDLLSYIHMGFMSRYEKEIVIEIENGIVQNMQEYDNRLDDPPRGYVRATTLNLTVDVPKKLKLCYEPVSDTICFFNEKDEIYINGIVYHEPANRLEKKQQIDFVLGIVDSCITENHSKLSFGEIEFEKQRYGSVAWADGITFDFGLKMRVLAMSNFSSRLIVTIISKGNSREKFEKITDTFCHSLIFMEF